MLDPADADDAKIIAALACHISDDQTTDGEALDSLTTMIAKGAISLDVRVVLEPSSLCVRRVLAVVYADGTTMAIDLAELDLPDDVAFEY